MHFSTSGSNTVNTLLCLHLWTYSEMKKTAWPVQVFHTWITLFSSLTGKNINQVMSPYIALYTMQIKAALQENSLSIMQEDNNKESFLQLKSIYWWFSDVIIQFSCLPIVSVQSVKHPQRWQFNQFVKCDTFSSGCSSLLKQVSLNQHISGFILVHHLKFNSMCKYLV